MLKAWTDYQRLAGQVADEEAELVRLSDAHIWHLPAYAQTEYIYDGHAIIRVDEARYHHTPMLERVNQFDAMGTSYGAHITEITIEKRLGQITAAAAEMVAGEAGIMRADGSLTSGKLMVIDALRTVDATYLLGAANPLALENKLLALPGTSAHNKGMAVDLTLVYEDGGAWCDADMLGHIDHPDMVTNHRNYAALSAVQQHNRLYLEQVMLRGAIACGMLLAPLREEFWDFRFPEDGLDLWRVLEAIARAAGVGAAFETCRDNIEQIHTLLRAGDKEAAYGQFALDGKSFAAQCVQLFGADDARAALERVLHTTPESLAALTPVYHGGVGLVFDAMLPGGLRQANPELGHLFV